MENHSANKTNIVLPLVVFFLLSFITVTLWQQDIQQEEEVKRRHTESTAEQVRLRLEDFMAERLSSLKVLVDRWVERRPPDFSYTRYRQFAENYFRHYPGFQAINWADEKGFVRWVYPEKENQAIKDKNLHSHPEMEVRESIDRAEGKREPVITPCVTLLQGGVGFSSYWPLVYDGKLVGYINGSFNVKSVVESRVGKTVIDQFRLILYEGNRVIYQSTPGAVITGGPSIRAARTIRFWDKTWRLELEPLELRVKGGPLAPLGQENPARLLFFIFGLILSAGLSFLLYSLMLRIDMYRLARDKALYEVNERKQAEKALRESEEKQKTLLTTIPDIVTQIDRNRIRSWCNDAGYAFFGDNVIGKKEDHYLVGNSDVSPELQSLLDGEGDVAYVENWQRRRDGTPRLLAWWYRRLSNDYGKVAGAICTARDITEQRRLEQEREDLLQELSDKNAELESFVYTVSHDLKTPIVTIEGFIGALREDYGNLLGPEGEKYLGRMTGATQKMEALINDLLDLSRIGRVTEEKAEVSFTDLAKEAAKSFYAQVKEQNISIEISEGMPFLYGERKRLGQVVDNLMANAVKYIGVDNPSPRIEVGAERQGGETIFFIKDNGIGIDKMYFDKIFSIFQRLPSAKKIDGTGMGLTIVKRIVELHGGRVWVESEVGKGSTFYFTIRNREDYG